MTNKFPVIKFKRKRVLLRFVAAFEVTDPRDAEAIQQVVDKALGELESVATHVEVSFEQENV